MKMKEHEEGKDNKKKERTWRRRKDIEDKKKNCQNEIMSKVLKEFQIQYDIITLDIIHHHHHHHQHQHQDEDQEVEEAKRSKGYFLDDQS